MERRTSFFHPQVYLILGISLLLVFFLTSNYSAANPEDPFSQVIKMAREKYSELKKSSKKQKLRQNWEEVIDSYRKISNDFPENPSLDEVLFTMAHLYLGLFGYSGFSSDLNHSLNSFRQVYTQFPKSRLADDALFMIGEIYLRYKKIPLFARVSFEKLIDQYPNADKAPSAKKRLKEMNTLYSSLPVSTPEEVKKTIPEEINGKSLKNVNSIKHWTNPSYTRIVINVDGQVNFQDNKLTDPDRLFIDLSPARLNFQIKEEGIAIDDGLLKRVRAGQNKADVVRVVLDIDYIEKYRVFILNNPFRLIVDVKGKEEVKSITGKPSLPQAMTQPPISSQKRSVTKKLTLAQQLNLGIRRVVIDPGHGGKDPGTIGLSGLKEKDIVLDVSRKLKQKIETELGLEVILTRNRDVFLPLEERTAIANTREADLFISIHTNAHRNGSTRGIETYFLNLASSEDAMEVAARENMVSHKNMSDLENILSEILLTSKIDESRQLAHRIQRALVSNMKRSYDGVYDLGVKQAPFYVLIGAQMPSILVEISFLSNREEETRLQKEDYREKLAQGILRGVEEYAHQMKMAFQNNIR